MKYMLDTNICIYVINNKSNKLIRRFKNHDISDVCISSVTFAELVYGVQKSVNHAKNWIALMIFLQNIQIINYGTKAAQEYGAIRAYLEAEGKTIGIMDSLIAGHALSENLTLVTNNTREFERVEGLKVEDWTE